MSKNYDKNPTKSVRVLGGSRYIKPDAEQFGFFIQREASGVALTELYWNDKKKQFGGVQEATLYPAWEIAYKFMVFVQKFDRTPQASYKIISSKEI